MADFTLAARSPLACVRAAATPPGDAGVVLRENPPARAFTVLAARGAVPALVDRCQALGVVLPQPRRRLSTQSFAILWTGPGQWFVQAEPGEADRLRRVFGSLATLCATVTNDDARLTVGIEGPRARDTLAKMLTIDLDERAFRPGDAAVTVAAGISVYVWLREDAPIFECAVPRSFATSFWDWLVGSAAEYGCAVAPA